MRYAVIAPLPPIEIYSSDVILYPQIERFIFHHSLEKVNKNRSDGVLYDFRYLLQSGVYIFEEDLWDQHQKNPQYLFDQLVTQVEPQVIFRSFNELYQSIQIAKFCIDNAIRHWIARKNAWITLQDLPGKLVEDLEILRMEFPGVSSLIPRSLRIIDPSVKIHWI